MKRNTRQLFFMVLVLAAGAYIFVRFTYDSLDPDQADQLINSGVSLAPDVEPILKDNLPDMEEAAPTREALWKAVLEKYGDHLKAEYKDGKLVSIEGQLGQGTSVSEFNLKDRKQVIERVEEVLLDLHPLFGFDSRFPFGEPQVLVTATSGQVTYPEVFDEREVAPHGKVTVKLGQKGELTGFYSTYQSPIVVQNSQRLSQDQAREKAFQATQTFIGEGAGREVVWVGEKRKGTYPGRRAYSFYAKGHLVIVDAETGRILNNRDERHP